MESISPQQLSQMNLINFFIEVNVSLLLKRKFGMTEIVASMAIKSLSGVMKDVDSKFSLWVE